MPAIIGILDENDLQDAPYTAGSLAEAARFEGDGVYTVTRTYKTTKTLLLDAHLERMEESARLENIPLSIDRPRLKAALRQLIIHSGFPESRFRITVPQDAPETFILTVEPFSGVPEAHKRLGVATISVRIARTNPTSKDNAWMTERQQAIENVPDAYEYLIVNEDQQILEGFGSNFYAIRDSELFTAADGDVLGGISRKIVLDVAPAVCDIILQPIKIDDLDSLSEAFLTSSSRGVIPIVKIDGHTIGTGRPGPQTQTISAAYDRWVERHLEEL